MYSYHGFQIVNKTIEPTPGLDHKTSNLPLHQIHIKLYFTNLSYGQELWFKRPNGVMVTRYFGKLGVIKYINIVVVIKRITKTNTYLCIKHHLII